MRELTDHIVPGGEDLLLVAALDDSHQEYVIAPRQSPFPGVDPAGYNPKDWAGTRIPFQRGPVKEQPLTGVSNEALLAIVIDRLKSFETGPLKSHYNAQALVYCFAALTELKNRTRDRMGRGVEGTNKP